MFSRINLTLGAAFAAIGLCSFIQSSPANEALADLLASNDNDDVERDDTGGKDDKSHRRRLRTSGSVVNSDSGLLANASENLSLAVTNVTEAAEAEAVVVTGNFDIYPVPYPALPPV
jgi:hypothetical protein